MGTIPPIGEPKRENQESEILYMRRQVVENDDIYELELHFLSDHQVISKITKNGESQYRTSLWRKFEQVVKASKAPGWSEVCWNPLWQPSLGEFVKAAGFRS
jgi:hypothetical protein